MHPPLIVLAGPTGVGKSELALSLAEAVDGDIVSVDSRQVYRGMDIGTAKPGRDERSRVRHHMLDLVGPDQTYSAGRFVADARIVLESIAAAGRTALLVGGSGLYLSALIDGLFGEPAGQRQARREDLARRLETEGPEGLWRELGRLDPAAQRVLEPGDHVRIQRALELAGDGGRAGRWQRDRVEGVGGGGTMICLHRHREVLYARIDARAEQMLAAGWLAEVEGLLAAGGRADDPGLATLGYADLVDHLGGRLTLAAALASIRTRTRQYAKRQVTWWRRDRRFRWLDLDRLGTAGARDRIRRQFDAVCG